MTLFPLHAHERSPHGMFNLDASTSVEGGMLGHVVDSATVGIPEVELFDDSSADLHLVGLLDDSTSAPGSRGVTGIGSALAPGITDITATGGGPPTHLASGKATIWLDPGSFVTDTWDTADGTLGSVLSGVSVGELLYAGSGGVLGLLVTGGTNEVGQFIRRFVGGQDAVDDFDSFFMPRVQPLPEGTVFMVLRFKG